MSDERVYDPDSIARYFDSYGEREWLRLVSNPANEVSLHLHTHYLTKHIREGMRVLEIGAGAGRFTQLLAGLGANIVAADISSGQLALNRQHAAELNFAGAVEDWLQVDICDMHSLPDASFDAVVAYGGPLSYALDRRDDALRECQRVLRPGGVLLLSVMCLWGSVRRALREILLFTPAEVNQRILASGDISPVTYPDRPDSYMHLFHADELRAWLQATGGKVIDFSASGCLASGAGAALDDLRAQPALWQQLLEMELRASAQPGCLEMGTHLIAVCLKT